MSARTQIWFEAQQKSLLKAQKLRLLF